MQKIWKNINGFEFHEVSSTGQFRSITHITTYANKYGSYEKIKKGRLLKIQIDSCGYLQAGLSANGKRSMRLMHRLVAIAFIPNPENKPEVNHLDGNKLNNNVENLEWATKSENQIHAYKTGLIIKKNGEKNGNSKLTNKQVLEIRKSNKLGVELSKLFNISTGAISQIRRRGTWAHI